MNTQLTTRTRYGLQHIIFLTMLLCLLLSGTIAKAQKDTVKVYFNRGSSQVNVPMSRLLDRFLADHPELTEDDLIFLSPEATREQYQSDSSLSGKRISNLRNYLLRRKSREAAFSKGLGDYDKATGADPALSDERWIAVIYDRIELNDSLPSFDFTTVAEDATVVMENLEFEGGSSILLRKSMPIVYGLLKALQDNPQLKIRLEGHVCCIIETEGTAYMRANTLSFARARAVYEFLVRNGIPANRLSFTGFANSRPLEINGFADISNYRNRRVEIRVLSK